MDLLSEPIKSVSDVEQWDDKTGLKKVMRVGFQGLDSRGGGKQSSVNLILSRPCRDGKSGTYQHPLPTILRPLSA